MSKAVGAKAKGWMKNTITGEKKFFMYNPSTLEYSRNAVYAETASPGSPYPGTQYVRGEAVAFDVPLFFHDIPYTGIIVEYMNFLNKFMPPEHPNAGYGAPPTMLFCQGYFIRTCAVLGISYSIEDFDSSGGPAIATITLSLRQVGI